MEKKYIKSEYYVQKLPLYLREGLGIKLNSYYSWLELISKQLEGFNVGFKTNIDLIQTIPLDRDQYSEILSKGIYQTQFQKKLKFYYEQSKYEEKKTLIYYSILAHLVETSTLRTKGEWRNILYSFSLVSKSSKNVVIEEGAALLTLNFRPGTDVIIIWIFKNLLGKKWRIIDTANLFWENIDALSDGIYAGFDGIDVLYEDVYFDFESVNESIEDKYE